MVAQPELKDSNVKSAFNLASDAKNEALILALKTGVYHHNKKPLLTMHYFFEASIACSTS